MINTMNIKLPAVVAYEKIREKIITVEFEPGKRLVENELAQWLNFSKAPIREALLRLEGDGLVERVQFKGCQVVPISRKKIRNAYEMRAVLESHIIKKIADNLNDEDYKNLERIVEIAKSNENSKDIAKREKISKEFHMYLILKGDNYYMLKVVNRLYVFLERARYYNARKGKYFDDSTDEHMQIVRLLKEKSVDEAALVMKKHILDAGERLKFSLP